MIASDGAAVSNRRRDWRMSLSPLSGIVRRLKAAQFAQDQGRPQNVASLATVSSDSGNLYGIGMARRAPDKADGCRDDSTLLSGSRDEATACFTGVREMAVGAADEWGWRLPNALNSAAM